MTAEQFDDALKRVLVHEGGYVNHPADPGGATNKGVTQRVYDGWRRRQKKPPISVRDISDAEVAAIYRFQYWDEIRADAMPPGVDYVVFDGAVNSGPSQAVKWLQRALGVVADGIVGAATLDALDRHRDPDVLIADMLSRRLAMLKSLRTWSTFGKGWSRRLAEVKRHGQAVAQGSVGPAPSWSQEGAQRARIEDIATAPAPIGGSAGAGAGGVGVAVVVKQAQDLVQPLAGTDPRVNLIFSLLVGAGVVVAVGGAVYGIWASRRNAKVAAVVSGEAKADLSALPAVGAAA